MIVFPEKYYMAEVNCKINWLQKRPIQVLYFNGNARNTALSYLLVLF